MSWTIRRFAVLLMLLGAAGCGASLLELSRRGDLQAVQQALQRGSNVNARTVQGHSPLSLAAREGHPDVVRALIQAGADPDAVAWSLSTHPRPRAFRHQGLPNSRGNVS